ncbi:Modification methylase DpnIIB [Moorella thermoacetica]|uniref:Methyltransferase n=1 Tax=Neomoorella thermoacetica TaxID=1525 RepID=A0AAC9MTU6_NEOTH|nr:site-specific DNA-methyltransferase [Moorella thermoacetica]AOQ23070.1 Modification methylase DpnIIB [Moorella thermoacetica]TYL08963.1 Modification methylase DpnIIB [Moorella thermoacetica]
MRKRRAPFFVAAAKGGCPIKPSYTDGVITIYHDDCLTVMPFLAENGVAADMIITDPPYGISRNVVIKRGEGTKFSGGDISLYFGPWDDFAGEEDFWGFTLAWVRAADKLLRPGGMFCSFFDRDKINFLSAFLQKSLGYKQKGYFLWVKPNPVPQVRKVKFMNAWEVCGMWQKPGGPLTFDWRLGQHPDYLILPTNADGKRLHPTQKPLRLAETLVAYWSRPGDLILDPFLGSGTTVLAAKRLGRKCIGIEQDEKYCRVAAERCRQGFLQFDAGGG